MDYRPSGVCSKMIHVEEKDGRVHNVQFIGGCSGNTQGVAALIEGMEIDEAIARLEGIRCGYKSTSCPDQLSHALRLLKK